MKLLHRLTLLTDRYPHVIKTRVYYYRRFLKRCILKPNENERIDANTLSQLLKNYFPGLRFFDIEKSADNLDIRKYFIKEQGKWILDITAMSKNENYARLFPKDISHWDEDLARSKYGSVDVIRFFIYEQNETFFSKIPCLSRTINFEDPEKFLEVPEKFLEEIDYYEGTDVLDLWDFFEVVAHKPPDIHKAFTYYARRQYNLLAFALEYDLYNDNDPLNSNVDHLIKEVYEFIDKKVKELYPEIRKWSKEKQNRLFEKQQEILENKPEKGTDVPREWVKFIEQLEDEIIGIKIRKYDDYDLPYTKNDSKTINNLFAKIEPYLNEDELEKIQPEKLCEKVDLLRKHIKEFSKKEQTSIEKLFLKKKKLSLDKNLNENEDEKPRNLYNATSDEQYLNPEDSYNRKSIRKHIRRCLLIEFKNEFEDELGEKIKSFLFDLLPRFFEEYLLVLHYDFNVNSKTNQYRIKKKLCKDFCKLAGIQPYKGIEEQFMVMFKRAIDNFKRNLKDIEGENYGQTHTH